MKQNKLTANEAMALGRRERRLLGKINGVKIPGSTKPFVKNENKKQWGLTTFTGIKK